MAKRSGTLLCGPAPVNEPACWPDRDLDLGGAIEPVGSDPPGIRADDDSLDDDNGGDDIPPPPPDAGGDTAEVPVSDVISQMEAEIPRLRRFARAMVRDAALADDLVQECLERALSRLHLWRPGTNLRAWLFTILRNLHINGIRRRQVLVDIDGEILGGLGAAAGAQIVHLELRDLQRALAILPTEQREVVLLIGLEGISYGEAAEILDISIGTVKSRLSRGRRALRLLMEGRESHEGTGHGTSP